MPPASDFHNFNTCYRDNADLRRGRLHRRADPGHRGPQVSGRARRQALPEGHPHLRRSGSAGAHPEAEGGRLRLRLQRYLLPARHERRRRRAGGGRQLRAPRPEGHHAQKHQARHRRWARCAPAAAKARPRGGSSRSCMAKGLKVVAVRHPMPYGDLAAQKVQRFAKIADLAETQVHHRGDGGVRTARRARQRDLCRRGLRSHPARGRERPAGLRRDPLGRRQQRLPVLSSPTCT
ncbi:MAG: hypothetical protein MZV70_16045 [Desulfobacterales bacterium]|nr:hypothetical protein [Desulfobacterales bacterium]